MANLIENETAEAEPLDVERVAMLLGGSRILRRRIRSPLDAHEMLLRGLPPDALSYFINRLVVLEKDESVFKAIGMSLRTFQRRRGAPARPLSREQSGRAWKFAEILARATEVLGSQEEAEQWLERPSIGLDQRRPIDLLETPAGVELVEDYLTRIEYGVYT